MLGAQAPEAEAWPRMQAEGRLDSGWMAQDEKSAPESTPGVQDQASAIRAGRGEPFRKPEQTRVQLRQRIGGVGSLGPKQIADGFPVFETLDRVHCASALAPTGQSGSHT